MRKSVGAALRSALKDWAIFITALAAMSAAAQVATPPGGPIKTQGPYLKYPFLKSPPAGRICSVEPKMPFPGQESPNCPSLPPASPCLVAQRCSDVSKPGVVVPL